jgi:3-deoxy-D-manno-octulosonic-acid transferase
LSPHAARAGWAALLALAQPLYRARLQWRARREPLYAHALGERFGHYDAGAVPGAVWLHAVSLGETRAAASLVYALRELWPDVRLLLTHGTATGRAAGAELLRPGDAQAWLPYDTPAAVTRFLEHFAPRLGVLMETEVWPTLLHAARERGVPMVLASARLSERSLRRARQLAPLLRPAAADVTLALAQTDDDALRLRAAGMPQVEVAGNLKFDLTPDAAALARGRAWRAALPRAVLHAASMREGEDGLLLDAWRSVPPPRPLLLLVPRHPQRFDEVAARVAQRGLALCRRSSFDPAGPPPDAAQADVWLGDSLGEMPLYYALGDVALLGGSFAPLGGQNLIEAAACGSPLVMGPHTFNFADAAERSLAAGASRRAASIEAALRDALALLGAPAEREAMARAALAFAAAHRGAAMRMAQRIAALA